MNCTSCTDEVNRVQLHLNAAGRLSEVRFGVVQDHKCKGPGKRQRAVASDEGKAGEAIWGVKPSPASVQWRRLLNLAQLLQSHATTLRLFSQPQTLLGEAPDSASIRDFKAFAFMTEIAQQGMRLKVFGQAMAQALQAWIDDAGDSHKLAPAGQPCNQSFAAQTRAQDHLAYFRHAIPEMRLMIIGAFNLFKHYLTMHHEAVAQFGNFPTLFLALVGDDGLWTLDGGRLQVVDSEGVVLQRALDPQCDEAFGNNASVNPQGIYRVGPLARLNLCQRMGTALADAALGEWREHYGMGKSVITSSFHYHTARLIEMMAAIEQMDQLLDEPDAVMNSASQEQSEIVRPRDLHRKEQERPIPAIRFKGAGATSAIETPHGTLFQHLKVNPYGAITHDHVITPNAQNRFAVQQACELIIKHHLGSSTCLEINPNIIGYIKAVLQAYGTTWTDDTQANAVNQLRVQVIDSTGTVIRSHQEKLG